MEQGALTQLIDLSNKTAIVTGGAMGIGFGIAYRLAEAGARVVIADVNKQVADQAVAKLAAQGWTACAVETDVSNQSQVEHMVSVAVQTYGSVDILVNNAGIYPNIPVMKLSESEFDHITTTNLKSVFFATKAAAAQMIAQGTGGKIINVTSIDAVHPSMVGLATYDASKHGVWGFTKNVALELASKNITVNAIAPGSISTEGTGADKPRSQELEAAIKSFTQKIPMRRTGVPDDIGKVALFLASGLSDYMTGTQVVVDGGYLLS